MTLMTRQQHGAGMESGEMNTSAGLLVGWMDDWMGGGVGGWDKSAEGKFHCNII